MIAWPAPFRPEVSSEIRFDKLRLFDSYKTMLVPCDSTNPFTMYVCGITPYDATHIGHAATYLSFDLVHRYLLASGQDVRFLENVTDIDDPLFERARRDKESWQDLADEQMRLFVADMTNLRILPPFELITVTEAMPRIIEAIEDLVDKGLTYAIEGEIYLDAQKVSDFSDLPMSKDEAVELFRSRGGDPDRVGKRDPLDPLLWRRSLDDEPHWNTPFGTGRPGWHIECNAISSGLLSENDVGSISLQGGGADLLFPHHYMTALQGRALTGANFASLYAHAGMIRYQGEKMSKSLGNLVFVSDLLGKGVHPMAIRIALMSGHYRAERDWDQSLLDSGQNLVDQLLGLLSRESVPEYDMVMQQITDALANDLDTPKALTLLRNYIHDSRDANGYRSPGNLSRFLDSVLGITL